jgi:hypothetical protein
MFGFLLFVYLSARYRSGLYVSTAVIAFFTLLFSMAEVILLVFGVLKNNIPLGFELNRIEQIIPNSFLWATPLFIHYLVDIGPKWKKFNLGLILFMAAASTALAVIGFVRAEWFISVTEPLAFDIKNAADAMRGRSGWAFDLRNLFLALVVVYYLAILIVGMVRSKKVSYLVFPAIGGFLAIAGGIDDLYFLYTGHNMLVQIPMSRFPIGISTMILLGMSSVFIHFLNTERALLETRRILKVSEQKNSILVEGTDECVFALNTDLGFVSANRKTIDTFGLNPQRLASRRFMDIVTSDATSRDLTRHLVGEKLTSLRLEKKPVFFSSAIVNPMTQEPEDYQFRFEYFQLDKHIEYIGRAWSSMQSTLTRCIEKESLVLSIENYMVTINEVCNRLTMNLSRFAENTDIQLVKMGLRELVINGIEHGNLNISFEEKTEALSTGRYFDLIATRQQLPEYRSRKVRIEYVLDNGVVSYFISDGGEGFDFNLYTSSVEAGKEVPRTHGRGILMARNIFDTMEYIGHGNMVRVSRKLGPLGS